MRKTFHLFLYIWVGKIKYESKSLPHRVRAGASPNPVPTRLITGTLSSHETSQQRPTSTVSLPRMGQFTYSVSLNSHNDSEERYHYPNSAELVSGNTWIWPCTCLILKFTHFQCHGRSRARALFSWVSGVLPGRQLPPKHRALTVSLPEIKDQSSVTFYIDFCL